MITNHHRKILFPKALLLLYLVLILSSTLFAGTEPLKVSADINFPPYSFLDERNKPAGFNVDLLQALSEEMDIPYTLDLAPWAEVRRDLEEEKTDVIIGMFHSEERDRIHDFSTPFITVDHSFFIRKGAPPVHRENLEGKQILVQEGDIMHDLMLGLEEDFTLIAVPDQVDALQLLSAGRYDAALLATEQSRRTMMSLGIRNIDSSGPPVYPLSYCIAVPQGKTENLTLFNEGLDRLKLSGRYNEIYKDWFDEFEGLQIRRAALQILLWSLLPLLLLISGVVLWNLSLKQRVDRATTELQEELKLRRKIQRELKDREEDLRTTLHSIGDGVVSTDREGRIRHMNPVAAALTGWSDREAKGRPIEEVLPIFDGRTGSPVPNPVRQVLKTRKSAVLAEHTLLRTRSGREYHIDDSAAPIRDDHGELTGVVLVFRDISTEYRMQRELAQNQKMEALGQLAGGIAHDFNNSLGGILGAAELLSQNCVDDRDREYLDIIKKAAKSSARLSTQLLSFSSGKPLGYKTADLRGILESSMSILKSSIDRNISIELRLEAENSVIWGEESQLENAFLNLGLNAAQAMPGGGRFTVGTRNRKAQDGRGAVLEIRLEDTGCGIPPEYQDKIFDPFFSTKQTGRGLGLATVYGTMQTHGGRVQVTSSSGRGTVFLLTLPLSEEELTQAAEIREPATGSGLVLLVDDEKLIRKTGTALLEHLGYRVKTAENGKDALDILESGLRPELILLDLIMPVMGGAEAFERISSLLPHTPVIICSGYSSDSDRKNIPREKVAAFLPKPYSLKELGSCLNSVQGSLRGAKDRKLVEA